MKQPRQGTGTALTPAIWKLKRAVSGSRRSILAYQEGYKGMREFTETDQIAKVFGGADCIYVQGYGTMDNKVFVLRRLYPDQEPEW